MKTNKILTLITLSTAMLTNGCANSAVAKNVQVGRLTTHLYTYESDAGGFNTKTFFYDNGEEVVAFDTQFTPELASQAIAYLRTQTSHPITYAVVTHPNPDKFNGMSVFQQNGSKIVMSDQTANSLQGVQDYKQYYFVKIAKMFTDETYPKLAKPDVVFHQTFELRLNSGETIALSELSNPGVSSNQTVAYIPKMNALMVGDLVHHEVHAWLEGGIVNGKPTPTLKGWISDLREIESKFSEKGEVEVYGGRGSVVKLSVAVRDQIAYLKTADILVAHYIKKLGAKRGELLGAEASSHYQAIQKEFETKFPKYSLSYMIAYGVYGLVNSKL